jgi:AraC family transcriptional regulator of adaptative response / DNA-3-methyladenine glycosylase II
LAGIGLTGSRIATLIGISQAALADRHLFEPRRDLSEAVESLRRLPGIGEWTAQYIAMRAMGESDAFLVSDVAVRRQLTRFGLEPSSAKVLARAERWRPWRAYAMLHLWMADSDHHASSAKRRIRNAISA